MRGFLLGLLASLSVGCGLFQIDKDLSVTSGTGGDGTTATAGSGGSNTGGSGGVTTTTEALKPLVFEMSELNEGRIVLGGDPEWQSFGSYTITNPNDVDITLDSVTLAQISDGGDAADFVNVGVNHGPTVLGQCSLALDTQACLLSLVQNLLVIPKNSSTTILEMLGRMANVQSSAECSSWIGCARSGHSPALAVTSITAKEGPISATFVNSPPVRVLHKARPIVELLPINEPLHDGLNTIAIVKITTDTGHAISFRQLTLEFQPSPELTIDVNGIKPWVSGIVEVDNNDCMGVHPPTGFAQLCWTVNEQYVPFIGGPESALFSLRVNVSGVVSSSSIKTSFFQYANEGAVKPLRLVGTNGGPGAIPFLVGNIIGSNDPTTSSSLLWSDLSEGENHDQFIPTSYDVFTKAYVSGVDGYSLVTAP